MAGDPIVLSKTDGHRAFRVVDLVETAAVCASNMLKTHEDPFLGSTAASPSF